MSNRIHVLTVALCCLCLELLCFTNFSATAQTQSTHSANHSKIRKTKRFIGFKPPGQSQPNYTLGAATRNSGKVCDRDRVAPKRNLTALVSSADRAITLAARPDFLVYVPETSARKAALIVKDKSEQYFYQKSFTLPKQAGIFSIKLPKDAPVLKPGKEYNWSVVLVCGQSTRPNDPFVSGKVTRAERSQFPQKSEKISLSKRANFYEQNLIWYDMLSTVAKLKRLQPDNAEATQTWKELLKEVDLADLGTQPIGSLE